MERVAHLVLMQLLPALADGDLTAFGAALTEVQQITGGWFAAAQGGAFASGPTRELVERMTEFGAAGVGQSSWGPTVYGLVPRPALTRDGTWPRGCGVGLGCVFRTKAARQGNSGAGTPIRRQRGALVHSEWALAFRGLRRLTAYYSEAVYLAVHSRGEPSAGNTFENERYYQRDRWGRNRSRIPFLTR